MSLGDNLKRLRKDKGWTQGDLAKKTEIKLGHISKIERDETDPKLSTLYKLIEALDCSSDSLMETSKTISPALKAAFERAENLPDDKKLTIIDLIDNYCIANSMKEMMEGDRQFFRMKGEYKTVIDEIK